MTGVINTDTDDEGHQNDKELIDSLIVQLFVEFSACHTAAYATQNHEAEREPRKFRNCFCDERHEEGSGLTE